MRRLRLASGQRRKMRMRIDGMSAAFSQAHTEKLSIHHQLLPSRSHLSRCKLSPSNNHESRHKDGIQTRQGANCYPQPQTTTSTTQLSRHRSLPCPSQNNTKQRENLTNRPHQQPNEIATNKHFPRPSTPFQPCKIITITSHLISLTSLLPALRRTRRNYTRSNALSPMLSVRTYGKGREEKKEEEKKKPRSTNRQTCPSQSD